MIYYFSKIYFKIFLSIFWIRHFYFNFGPKIVLQSKKTCHIHFLRLYSTLLITVSNQINALHRGTFEFRVCSADGLSADPTMECFHKNKLTFAPGVDFRGKPIRAGLTQIGTDQPYTRTKNPLYIDTEGMRVDDITGIKGWQTYKVQLPKDLTCRHCVFQVIWIDSLTRWKRNFAFSHLFYIQDAMVCATRRRKWSALLQ